MDIAVKRDNFGEGLFFEAVHENRLFVKSWKGEQVPVTFTMFRKDIVENILANRVIKEYVGNGKGTGGYDNAYIFIKFANIINNVRPLINQLVEDIQSTNQKICFYIMDSLHGYRKTFLAANWIIDDFRFSRIVDLRIILTELIKSGELDRAEALVTEHIRAVFIERFMNDTRKTWIPGGHEGSQSSDSAAHRILCNSIIEALDKEKAVQDAE